MRLRNLRWREVELRAQSYRVRKKQSWDSSPGHVLQRPIHIISTYHSGGGTFCFKHAEQVPLLASIRFNKHQFFWWYRLKFLFKILKFVMPKQLNFCFAKCIKFIVGVKTFLSLFCLTELINVLLYVALFSSHSPFLVTLLVIWDLDWGRVSQFWFLIFYLSSFITCMSTDKEWLLSEGQNLSHTKKVKLKKFKNSCLGQFGCVTKIS